MTPREELDKLRREKRIRELEAKRDSGVPVPRDLTPFELPSVTQAKQYAGSYLPASGKVEDMSTGSRLIGSGAAAVERGALGLKGYFTDLTDADKERLEQGRAFTSAAGWPGFLGEEGVAAGASAAAGGPFGQLARIGLRTAGPLVQALGRGAAAITGDTAVGALMSPENRTAGAVGGLIGGVGGQVTGGLAHGALAPFMRPEAQALIRSSEGRIIPTVGQALGGFPNRLEQKLTSLPLVGEATAHARNRAVDQWSAEALSRVLPPQWRMGLPNRGLGDEAVFAVGDRISDMYRDALSRFPQRFAVDPGALADAGAQAARRGDLALSETAQARVNLWVQQNLVDRAHQMTPEVAKRIESDLGAAIRNLRSSPTGEDRAIGAALGDVQQAWRTSLTGIGDAGGEGAGQALRQADASYHAFLPIDTAAAKRVSQNAEEPGRFTPRTLRQGYEQVDQSKNNRASRRVAAGIDPYQPPPARPAPAAAAVEPDPFTRGPQTPLSSGTDLAVVPPSSPFGFGGAGGGQLGPLRSGELGAARTPPGAPRQGAPYQPPPEAAPGAPGGLYRPYDDINQLTRQGEMVLPDRVPDSGTAGRAGLMALPAGLAAAYQYGGLPAVSAATLAGTGAAVGSMEWAQRMMLQGNRGAQAFNDYLLGPALSGAGINAGARAGAPDSADERRQKELARQLREQGLVE